MRCELGLIRVFVVLLTDGVVPPPSGRALLLKGRGACREIELSIRHLDWLGGWLCPTSGSIVHGQIVHRSLNTVKRGRSGDSVM